MKKRVLLSGLLIFTLTASLFVVPPLRASPATAGKQKISLISPHFTTFRDDSTSVSMLGVNFEWMFGTALSFNVDTMVPRNIIPALTLELGAHIYPLGKAKMKQGCLEILGGGGMFFAVGGEGGAYPTAFTGLRYFLTDKAGLYFTCRWVFGEFDVDPGIPFVTVGVSFIKNKKAK